MAGVQACLSRSTGIEKVALCAGGHQSALRNRLPHLIEARTLPDFPEIRLFEITYTKLGEELAGDDIRIGKNIHASTDRVASCFVLGRLVGSHDERLHVRRTEPGIVSKLQSPIRSIDSSYLGVQFVDAVRVKPEFVGMPTGLAVSVFP